jgi:hypothetical protein
MSTGFSWARLRPIPLRICFQFLLGSGKSHGYVIRRSGSFLRLLFTVNFQLRPMPYVYTGFMSTLFGPRINSERRRYRSSQLSSYASDVLTCFVASPYIKEILHCVWEWGGISSNLSEASRLQRFLIMFSILSRQLPG